MEIIKKGIVITELQKIIPPDNYIKICTLCACVYTFNKSDVKKGFDRMDTWNYVTCPFCNKTDDVYIR